MESLSLPMPPHSSNHTGSLNTTVISTIQIKQNAAISFTPTNVHRTREQTSSWQGSQKVTSFQVCFDNVKNVTISPPQNTHCKNVFKKKKKKSKLERFRDQKKKVLPLSSWAVLQLFFVIKFLTITLKKIIILIVASEHRNWWMLHRESGLVSDLDKAEWAWGTCW